MHCPHCVKRAGPGGDGPYRTGVPKREPVLLVAEPHVAGVEIARCPSCRGAFVAHDAMKAIDTFGYDKRGGVSTFEMARRASGTPTKAIRCPACDEETTRREWSFNTLVMVDICVDCRGVWLDGGELEALDGSAPR